MARRILGIDVGSDSVKFVQIEKPLRGRPIIRAIKRKIPAGSAEGESVITELIRKTIEESFLFSDDYVVSIPSGNILLREIELPFKDRSKIDRVLKFNIEQSIPFQPEDIVADFTVDSVGNYGAKVTAFLARKEDIQKQLDLLSAAGIDPRIIGCSSYCAGNLIKKEIAETEDSVALIDIGASSVTLSVYYRNQLRYMKFSRTSIGSSLTEQIAAKLDIGIEEAEKLKCSFSITEGEETEDSQGNRANKIVLQLVKKIAQDTALAISSYNSKRTDGHISAVYLTGGGALIKGITSLFQKYVGVQTSVLKPILGFGYDYPFDDPLEPSYNAALSLAVSELPITGKRINFRKEEFTFKWIDVSLKKSLKYAGVFAGLIVILYLTNSIFSLVQLKKENTLLSNELIDMCRTIIPQGKVVDVIVQSQRSLSELKEKASKFQDIIDVNVTPLEVIKQISSDVESASNIKVSNFSYKEDRIEFKGVAKSADDVKKLEKKLASAQIFENVVLQDVTMNQEKNVADFRIEIKMPKRNESIKQNKSK